MASFYEKLKLVIDRTLAVHAELLGQFVWFTELAEEFQTFGHILVCVLTVPGISLSSFYEQSEC